MGANGPPAPLFPIMVTACRLGAPARNGAGAEGGALVDDAPHASKERGLTLKGGPNCCKRTQPGGTTTLFSSVVPNAARV